MIFNDKSITDKLINKCLVVIMVLYSTSSFSSEISEDISELERKISIRANHDLKTYDDAFYAMKYDVNKDYKWKIDEKCIYRNGDLNITASILYANVTDDDWGYSGILKYGYLSIDYKGLLSEYYGFEYIPKMKNGNDGYICDVNMYEHVYVYNAVSNDSGVGYQYLISKSGKLSEEDKFIHNLNRDGYSYHSYYIYKSSLYLWGLSVCRNDEDIVFCSQGDALKEDVRDRLFSNNGGEFRIYRIKDYNNIDIINDENDYYAWLSGVGKKIVCNKNNSFYFEAYKNIVSSVYSKIVDLNLLEKLNRAITGCGYELSDIKEMSLLYKDLRY